AASSRRSARPRPGRGSSRGGRALWRPCACDAPGGPSLPGLRAQVLGRPGMSSDNLSVVQQVYASFAAGDVAAILASLTADVRWEVVGPPDAYPLFGVRTGTAEVAAFFQGVGENED